MACFPPNILCETTFPECSLCVFVWIWVDGGNNVLWYVYHVALNLLLCLLGSLSGKQLNCQNLIKYNFLDMKYLYSDDNEKYVSSQEMVYM